MNSDEEKSQRTVGALQAAEAILKQCASDVPHDNRRACDLLSVAQIALGKAILAVWDGQV